MLLLVSLPVSSTTFLHYCLCSSNDHHPLYSLSVCCISVVIKKLVDYKKTNVFNDDVVTAGNQNICAKEAHYIASNESLISDMNQKSICFVFALQL